MIIMPNLSVYNGKTDAFFIDHSFLTFKKELEAYGFKIGKISMKEKTVNVEKI